MAAPLVSVVSITEPIKMIGKTFTGDYGKSQQYVTEIQEIARRENISFIPHRVVGIYYDNPQEKAPNALRSFHGVFAEDEQSVENSSLEKKEFSGRFLYVQLKGDPSKVIYEGYGALFNHLQQNEMRLRSNAGYQISTFENGEITTEIYLEIA